MNGNVIFQLIIAVISSFNAIFFSLHLRNVKFIAVFILKKWHSIEISSHDP